MAVLGEDEDMAKMEKEIPNHHLSTLRLAQRDSMSRFQMIYVR